MDFKKFEERKREHIEFALASESQASGHSGLGNVHLFHDALPDLDFSEITLASLRFGKPSPSPFFVAAITAGHDDSFRLNDTIAACAGRHQWVFGTGSLRREVESLDTYWLDAWKDFRHRHPKLVIHANIGISQLLYVSFDNLKRVIDVLQAEALAVHLNPLQECLQTEGTPKFRGSLKALEKLCAQASYPVVLKETGSGFSKSTISKIADIGISAIDISGLGGTHWGRIEGSRAKRKNVNDLKALASETFANWGESTVDSLVAVKECSPNNEVWASGGVRSGLDAAKLIALGARQVGYAQPILEAAIKGEEALDGWMEQQEFELKIALFCTNCNSPLTLQSKRGVLKEVWKAKT